MMRINDNGVYRDATPEEAAAFLAMGNAPPVSEAEQWMDEIEAALIELAAMLTGGSL